jgi:hypothetical protein
MMVTSKSMLPSLGSVNRNPPRALWRLVRSCPGWSGQACLGLCLIGDLAGRFVPGPGKAGQLLSGQALRSGPAASLVRAGHPAGKPPGNPDPAGTVHPGSHRQPDLAGPMKPCAGPGRHDRSSSRLGRPATSRYLGLMCWQVRVRLVDAGHLARAAPDRRHPRM